MPDLHFANILHTFFGYVSTNALLYFIGNDLTNGDVIKNALIGISVSAFSAGLAAVMGIKRGECCVKSDGRKNNDAAP